MDFPHSSDGKESTCNAGDPGLIPGLERSPGEGIGHPLQYSWASLVVQTIKNPPAMCKWSEVKSLSRVQVFATPWTVAYLAPFMRFSRQEYWSGLPFPSQDLGSIPGLERSPGEGNGYPLQYSCLENSMDRGAWWVTVHGVTKSGTWLNI